jgi:hypothetical protein
MTASDTSPIEPNLATPLVSRTNSVERTARLAAALTASAGESPAFLARLQPLAGKGRLVERAVSIRARLEAHSRRLREQLERGDTSSKQMLQIFETRDLSRLNGLGVMLEYAWLADIIAAAIKGVPYVEVETVGPYAAHHIADTGELDVRPERLPNDEKTGILLSSLFRDVFRDCRNVRTVALLDDLTPRRDIDRRCRWEGLRTGPGERAGGSGGHARRASA